MYIFIYIHICIYFLIAPASSGTLSSICGAVEKGLFKVFPFHLLFSLLLLCSRIITGNMTCLGVQRLLLHRYSIVGTYRLTRLISVISLAVGNKGLI